MKHFVILIAFLPVGLLAQKTESTMSPSQWLGIWDNQKNVPSFNCIPIGFNDIPREINYKGTLVEVIEFKDANGFNLLILTQTGMYPVSKKNEAGVYEKQNDRAELQAFLYVRADEKGAFRQLWKTADYQECDNLDLYVGFTKKSLSITDLDGDGVAEVAFQYTKSCRGDVSPADRILTMIETNEKYVFRGITTLEGMATELPMMDTKIEGQPLFKAKMDQMWKQFESDSFVQFTYD